MPNPEEAMARAPDGSVRNAPFCLTRLAAAAAAALVLLSVQAEAQINPFRGYKGPTLNSQDIALAREAARKLLDNGNAAAGSSEQWENADSGHFGTITLMGEFQRSGMPCRTLQSRVEYKQPSKPRTTTLKACRTPSGEWKLL
jgi:surface antigen